MMTFTISDIEEAKMREWWTKHKAKCKLRRKHKPISYTYSSTPTGIGSIIEVRCSCGKSIDVTDVGSW